MNNQDEIKRVINLEIATLQALADSVGPQWDQAIELLLSAKRKVVLAGVGKSGDIATKIAATLSSTGTAAIFMHPTEALHGDLGMVERGDLLLLFSKSGESDELIALLPSLKSLECKVIAITANLESTLAKQSDLTLYTPVKQEACTLDLAPTCSTTAALVLGDALAVALMRRRDFKSEDFALYHPAGRLGKRLLYKVKDLMRQGLENPTVMLDAPFNLVVRVMGEGGVNAVNVIDEQGRLKGLITGFDLRKAFELEADLKSLKAFQIMFTHPVTVDPEMKAEACYTLMKDSPKPLNLLPVVSGELSVGIVTLQDMIREGL